MTKLNIDKLRKHIEFRNLKDAYYPFPHETILVLLDEIERLDKINDGFERVIVNQKQALFDKETENERLRKEEQERFERYCKALDTWRQCIEQGWRDNPDTPHQQGREYEKTLNQLFIDIKKSGLLWRILYCDEEVRTVKCPYHKGHMDTGMWVGVWRDKAITCECDGSGWVPNEGESNKPRSPVFVVTRVPEEKKDA